MLTSVLTVARRLFTRPREPLPCHRTATVPLRLEWLEAREVPATLTWKPDAPNLPAPANDKWSTVNNWVETVNGMDARPAAKPGAGDTVKFPASATSRCDVPKVASVEVAATSATATTIELLTDFEVTSSFDASGVVLDGNLTWKATWSGNSTFRASDSTLRDIDITFGSSTNHATTARLDGDSTSVILHSARIYNYGSFRIIPVAGEGEVSSAYPSW
jgi:hypothetical protein